MTIKKAPPTGDQIASIVASRVCRDPGLTIEHRLVAMFVCCAGYKAYCEIKDEEVTMATGLTVDRIEEILDDLAMLGYIRRDGYALRGKNPRVHLTVPYFPRVPKGYAGPVPAANVESV